MSLDKFKSEILKTGFVLENKISQTLKSHGWSVISNKYYEDDFEDKVREIDLIAYKVGKVQDFDVYTCLILSCKKSESNVWALLCRELNIKDPNIDLQPLHSWSNQPSIEYQLNSQNYAKNYYKNMANLGVKDVLDDPNVEIFAFQEMHSTKGTPQNDKAIHDSIISLIKAQAYEMTVLPERKKAPCVYQFNLLSVVDTEMIRLKFNEAEISAERTTSEHHVSRYILKRKQSFSKIRFLNSSVFESALDNYDKLHKANIVWYGKTCDEFYKGVEKDPERIKLYIHEFTKAVRAKIYFRVYKLLKRSINITEISLFWSDDEQSLIIFLDAEEYIDDVALELNGDSELEGVIATALQKVYRYTGRFRFEADIPF